MPLRPGDHLGPYEILSLLGKGGMGEVYRARDPRLQRDVAIKTSAQRFSDRFDREARAIAALNHPNICQIYDIGPNYIVMELVEGAPPKGPLALDETLRIAEQIIAALEAAHEKAITHRDLKPGNILLRADGVIKVLDFGLAKFGGTPTAPASVGEDSPTLSLAMTQAGMILGTAAYMAPEQARGKPVDNRADIWAFGVVVHELLTGERLFKGEDLTETLASVVKEKPDLSVIPRRLRRLLTACLEKDPAKRLQAIADARLLLEADEAPAPAVVEKPRMSWLWPTVAAILALGTGIALWAPWRAAPLEPIATQFSMEAPSETTFAALGAAFSVSPDGRQIVFAATAKNGQSLWLRSLDSLAARPLPTGEANFSFWSPDSKSLAFFSVADGKIKRLDLAGGAPLVLADANESPVGPTGTWSSQGVILFGSAAGLQRTSASGGGATRLTKADPARMETGHGFPQFLPDGNRFLYFISSEDASVQGVYASSLDHPEQRTQVMRSDAKAVYVPPTGSQPGYLLFMQGENLVAQRFDAARLQLQGDPMSVAANVGRNATISIRAMFWASEAGLLIYRKVSSALTTHRIVWMSRDGKVLGDALPEGPIQSPALSPDGTRLAIQRDNDIGTWEFARSVATRLTFEKEIERLPVWSPDGKQIAYVLEGKGIYRKDALGAGQAQVILASSDPNLQTLDWSPDGRFLLYRIATKTDRDLWAVPVPAEGSTSGGNPFPVIVAPSNQEGGRFSPDGKWIAYFGNESGQQEVYIQPFVEPGSPKGGPSGRWQVSNSSGANMVWRKDGRELNYNEATTNGNMMAVTVEPDGNGLKIGTPRPLFRHGIQDRVLHNFDVSSDGQRFLIQLPAKQDPTVVMTVVSNWQSALKK